ncbi:60S acidic ribosomal protein P2 [Klebsormidium nitens]|uniref:60S acidic ribosomal protein P2 n=1 Tax=Klebsormidium nitens TaxID=105231 RepID=A0A1Y1IF90_KLENI|nr:60S acidic ribosomal protein P2 [Klebsormidium nitens]|eukprot:GAQ87426.1 60S acidic ribosomal protein P2 [Klebsormidium nitens]
MKVVAAYLLAVLGGKSSPTEKDIKNILSSVGAEADDERIELLLKELEGKDITEVIALGREKFASVPSGGGGGGGGGAVSSGGGGGGAAEEKKEEKKEEKEEEEEEDEDMGFSLFD